MKDKLKLIICDIDWTLLSREKRVLSKYTIDVLTTLHEKGVLFGIASGRPIDEVKRVYKTWNMPFECDVIIAMNGGELWIEKNHSLLEYYKLKKEWIKEIVLTVQGYSKNLNPYIYYHNQIKAMQNNAIIQRTAIRNEYPLIIAKDVDDFADEENSKVMVRVMEGMDEFASYLQKHQSKNYQNFLTQSTLMEFSDSRISKGNALDKYCQITQLKPESIIAFGDTTNDNDMLIYAGTGVCLLNGSNDTKHISDFITKYDVENDGVAKFLDEMFLRS